MKWLTININPPKLDANIIARKKYAFNGEYAYHTMNKEETSSRKTTEHDLAEHLESNGLTEWAELD